MTPTPDVVALQAALDAGPTGALDTTWVSVYGSSVMLESPRLTWARIATCDRDQTARYIAACFPARITRVLAALRAAEQRAEAAEGLLREVKDEWYRLTGYGSLKARIDALLEGEQPCQPL